MDQLTVKTLKFAVGDIVEGYHKGYHKVTKIEQRFVSDRDAKYYEAKAGDEMSPLIHLTRLCDSNGNAPKGKKHNCCDAGFITKIDSEFIWAQHKKSIRESQHRFHKLSDLLEQSV